MDSPTLVTEDIRRGRQILKRLQANGVVLDGAFWKHDSDHESWRLVFASEEARRGSRSLVQKAVSAIQPSDLLSIEFVSPEDGFFIAVNKAYGEVQSYGRRVRNALVDGRYIDDAFVYSL